MLAGILVDVCMSTLILTGSFVGDWVSPNIHTTLAKYVLAY